MSDDQLAALAEQLRAVDRSPEAREARRREVIPRVDEWLAKQEMPPEKSPEERERLDKAARLKVAQDEANRPTIEKYAAYLRLHAKDESRTKAETVQYNALGKRHRWHGRPEHVVYRRDRRPATTLRRSAVRTPRARRFVRRARARAPGRKARSSDEPLDPPARVLYAHAAAFHGDPRVARWLESWADELLEDVE